MSKSVTINGTTYSNVPSVTIPLSTGSGNATFFETSDATIQAGYVLQGYTGYGASGKVTGTFTAATITQDSTTKVLTIS